MFRLSNDDGRMRLSKEREQASDAGEDECAGLEQRARARGAGPGGRGAVRTRLGARRDGGGFAVGSGCS